MGYPTKFHELPEIFSIPMTPRQLFYQAVSYGLVENTEIDYCKVQPDLRVLLRQNGMLGAASGRFILSLPPKRALSGLSKDRRQNAAVPRNVSPMRVTCALVSSIAFPMISGDSLRRP